jgi:choline-sulfatase
VVESDLRGGAAVRRAAWLFIVAAFACDDPVDDLEPPELEAPLKTQVFRPEAPPPADAPLRIRHHKIRSLVDDAARIEARQYGLVIDMGTPDQHKFMPPWQGGSIGEIKVDGTRAVAEVDGEVSYKLDVREHPVGHVLVRSKAAKGKQVLLLYIDGKYVGARTLTTEWDTERFTLDDELRPGFHDVRLALRGGHRHRMWLDWVYLRAAEEKAPWEPKLDKVAVRRHGTPERALVGDPPRTYSLWTEVPEDGALVFDYASDAAATFRVSVIADRAKPLRVFEESGPPTYREAKVDLSKWAGELVRLELVTRGAGAASWGDPWIARPGRPPRPREVKGRPPRGVIVLVVDTVRQDAFQVFRPKSRVQTPAFDALAKESTVFENAYTTAPWTKPSVTTILTGLYPSSHGAQSEEAKLSSKLTLLSEVLKSSGFKTGLFSANGYVSDYFGFTQGWDDYVNFPRNKERTQADNVYARSLEWLKAVPADKRFFLYVQTVDPHVPYQTPGRFLSPYLRERYDGYLGDAVSGEELADYNEGKTKMTSADRAYLAAMYDAEISYHDEYMGKFIEELRHFDLLDDTLLVITNDHGEEIFDHGKLDHGQSLYDELIRSPMLIRHPQLVGAGRHGPPVSIVDLAPTIYDALDVRPPDDLQGRSLLPAVQGGVAPSPAFAVAERQDLQRAIRFGPYKLILSSEGDTELYDLRKDRGERKNLARYRPVALRACETHLFEALRVPRALERPNGMGAIVRYEAEEAKIDRDLMEHLQALGYFND